MATIYGRNCLSCTHEETAILKTITHNTFFSVRLVNEKKFLFIISNSILPHGRLENEVVDKQELVLEYHNSVSCKDLQKQNKYIVNPARIAIHSHGESLVYFNNAHVKCV